MIKNIPTAEEFYESGKELLNFSWDVVAKLLTDLDEAEYFDIDVNEISENYWKAAKRRLTTALSVTQQGIELIIKGRIAYISPFLLIVDPPQKWPSPYEGEVVDFSKFRTIDAQDLIRVHDTFAKALMPYKFVDKFHELRKKRNQIIHSLDKNISVPVTDVIESLLFMHKSLFPSENWSKIRFDFLCKEPNKEFGYGEYATNEICREVSLVIDLLRPAQVKKYFNINKKQRLYFCPECLRNANTDSEFEYKLAVLSPK